MLWIRSLFYKLKIKLVNFIRVGLTQKLLLYRLGSPQPSENKLDEQIFIYLTIFTWLRLKYTNIHNTCAKCTVYNNEM